MTPRRGDLFWADLGQPRGSAPGFRRPVLVVSGDRFNASAIRTVTVAVLTTNLRLAESPGNILIEAGGTGPTRESVVNVSALTTVDRDTLEAPAGRLSTSQLRAVDRGLRLALGL